MPLPAAILAPVFRSTDQAPDLDRLVAEHGPALQLFARNWVDAASADDVLQEALLKLWRRGFAQVDDPVAYAFSCVRSAALDRIKSEARRRNREQQVGQYFAMAFEPETAGDDGRAELLAAVQTLNPTQREVLILRIWGDLSFPAIAKALGANVNTVTSRYRAALADLRSRLDPEDW